MMKEQDLIAACGMNCMLCQAYQGKGLSCEGCGQKTLRKSCLNCSIFKCRHKKQYCYECQIYPCLRLKNLDKRYRQKYHMSMLENLEYIQKYGIDEFIIWQNKKYRCHHCGHLKTVHQHVCLYCEKKERSKINEI